MFDKVKQYLFEPMKIADSVKNKWYKHLLFIGILVIIMSIYPIIRISFTKSYDSSISDICINCFDDADPVYFKINDYELTYSNGVASTQAVGTSFKIESFYRVNLIFLFDVNNSCDNVFNVLDANYSNAVVVKFTRNNLYISYQEGSATNVSGSQKLAITKERNLFSYTYQELGLKQIDFSNINNDFDNALSEMINSIIGKVVHKFLPLIIVGIIIAETLTLLIEAFFLGLLLKLITLRFKVSLWKCVLIVLLSSLPEAICMMFYSFTGLEFINIIGSIITAFYAYRVLVFYKIKYETKIGDVIKQTFNNFMNKDKKDDENNNEEEK